MTLNWKLSLKEALEGDFKMMIKQDAYGEGEEDA